MSKVIVATLLEGESYTIAGGTPVRFQKGAPARITREQYLLIRNETVSLFDPTHKNSREIPRFKFEVMEEQDAPSLVASPVEAKQEKDDILSELEGDKGATITPDQVAEETAPSTPAPAPMRTR